MRVLGIPFSRVKFVLNRANTRVGLTEADAERALQLKVDAALPSDIVVAESVNRGVPVVTSAPRSKFAKSIDAPGRHPYDRCADLGAVPTIRVRGPMTLSDHLRKAGTFLSSEEARARLLEEVHLRVHQRLIEELGPELSQGRLTAKDLRPRVNAQLQAALADETTPLSLADKARLGEDIANDILGYGPIQAYLEDPEVTEVMVNGPDQVYIERARQDRADADGASSTRPTCGASSTRSWARSAGASTRPRPWSTPACPTAPVSTP